MREPPRLPAVDAVIAGVGARTASGLTALQATMSARAHKLMPFPSHLLDKSGEHIAVARLMSIGDRVMGLERLVALGGPALTQAAFPWLSTQPAVPRLPVIVALPSEERPGFDAHVKRSLLLRLEARSRVPIDHARSSLVLRCRGGGVIAFERAIAMLAGGACEAVAVGGIDSYFDPDVLEWLDRELRLHSLQTENGFIPGEAAAFTLLVPRRKAGSLYTYGHVLSTASEDEPRPYGSDEPCLALGMTLTLKRVTAGFGGERRIPWLLTDVVNERHRVEEWSIAMARAHAALSPDVVHDQPLLKTGDVGAASAALLVVMVAVRFQTGCAVGSAALIATHSDGPERGAIVVSGEAA